MSLLAVLACLVPAAATAADGGAGPDRKFLRDFAETRGFLLGRPTRIELTPAGDAVLFLRTAAREPTLALYEYTVATGETRELVTPARLLGGERETVSVEEAARRERQRIVDRGLTSYELSHDGRLVLLPLSGKVYVYDRAGPNAGRVRALATGEGAIIDPRFSRDGRKVGFVRDNDLWVVDVPESGAGRARRLTRGGSPELTHGVAEFVAQEEMERLEGYFFSPDARLVAYTEVDQRGLDRFTIADPAHPETPANVFPYPRAGRANAKVRLGIMPTGGGATTWVKWDAEKYPYLARVLWDEPKAPLTLLVQTRDQREQALLAVDVASGKTRALLVEKDDAWLDLDRALPRWLPDGSGFLHVSEASGRRELVRHDAKGERVRVLVPGALGFHNLVELAEDGTAAIVTTAKPTSTQLHEIDLTTDAAPRPISPDDGAEHVPVAARSLAAYADTRTAKDAAPETAVFRRDGRGWRRMGVLPSVAEPLPFRVNLELATVKAGGRTHDVALVRPRDFKPGRKYPVIVNVYGGPTVLTVRADERYYLLHQWLADHGAVVVTSDNRGTPRHDRAWSRAIKGDFAKVPLDDQVAALEALFATRPELDRTRVGIYGWSFGGYMSALAVLKRPDVFKVAVAGAPVVDWHDYDTHYTERYLDLPSANPKGYEASNLLPLAKDLRRPLLLIHGTADDNVYFFHSLKLANALFRSGRHYEFLPLTVTHQVPDPVVREMLWSRIAEFLLRGLR